ncbi:MAG: hypothetical protein CM1200mP2_10690 [Planctomycetaceae bacterium]|nr:MAG: hypothetical protein CM1200mP2_10690 [Planctomycetaceae bacterium]
MWTCSPRGRGDDVAIAEAWGISRKFAVPLCEYYDAVEITVRQGMSRGPGPKLRRRWAERFVPDRFGGKKTGQ